MNRDAPDNSVARVDADGIAARRRIRRQYLHVFAAAACVGPFLSYILANIGWGPSSIGIAAALLTAGGVITAPLWGKIEDHHPGRAASWSLISATAAAIALAACVTIDHQPLVFVAAFLFGATSGSLEPLFTSATLKDPRVAPFLGRVRSAGSIGWIVGLGIGGLALTVLPFGGIVLLLAAIALVIAPRPRAPRPAARATASIARPVPWRAVMFTLSVALPIPIATSSFVYFTAGWAGTELGVGPLLAVLPLALAAALELPAFRVADRLATRVAPLDLVLLAYPPIIASAALVALVPGLVTLVLVQILVAVGFTFWYVGQSRLLAQLAPPAQMATAQTVAANLGRGIAGPIAGLLGGLVASQFSYAGMFGAIALIGALGAVRVIAVRQRGTIQREMERSGARSGQRQ